MYGSLVSSGLEALIKASYSLDKKLLHIQQRLQSGNAFEGFRIQDGLLRKKGKILMGPDEQLKAKILL